MQECGFRPADICRKGFEAVCLTCLTLQAFDLATQFTHHVVQTFKIGFGSTKAQFGFMAASMQARNASSLLQQRTTRLRLRLNELADAPLPDHGRRTCAGGLIRKEKLHILGACFLAVDPVERPRFAFDAARNLQFVSIIIAGWRATVRIVEKERNLRRIACGPRGGA